MEDDEIVRAIDENTTALHLIAFHLERIAFLKAIEVGPKNVQIKAITRTYKETYK